MSEKKPITIITLDAPEWVGPILNGKYTNFEIPATIEGNKGPMEVIIQVGSVGMTDKFKAECSYIGRFIRKTDAGPWLLSFMAKDNPSLAAPERESGGGGSHFNIHGVNGSEAVYMTAKLIASGELEIERAADQEIEIWDVLEAASAKGKESGINACVAYKATVELICAGRVNIANLHTQAREIGVRLRGYSEGNSGTAQ